MPKKDEELIALLCSPERDYGHGISSTTVTARSTIVRVHDESGAGTPISTTAAAATGWPATRRRNPRVSRQLDECECSVRASKVKKEKSNELVSRRSLKRISRAIEVHSVGRVRVLVQI